MNQKNKKNDVVPAQVDTAARRQFFKKVALGLGSMALFSKWSPLVSKTAFAAETLSESDPLAVSLGYVANATKTDVKKFPKRASADGKTQFCDNCMFYQKTDAKQGGCQIFQNKLVAAKGWCNSWAKKVG